MAAYAALVSLGNIIEQIQVCHTRRPFFLEKQLKQLESLHKKVSFLQDFLENYSNKAQDLEIKIADATHAAEDTIESHIVDSIHAQSLKKIAKKKKKKKETYPFGYRKKYSNHLSQDLQRSIEVMDSIRREAKRIKARSVVIGQQLRVLPCVGSLAPPPNEKDIVVGLDDNLYRVMDKVLGELPNLHIIPITGMGGIGKTTLARKVYENASVIEYFDVRAWVTISQEYNFDEMLSGLLREIGGLNGGGEQTSLEYHQLGKTLYQHLFDRRYLIILDDVWSSEAWSKLKLFLPDNNNRSRIVVTTRLSNVAESLGSFDRYKMDLLDENTSWKLFCRKVFVQESCPGEFEDVGKEIAKNCKGLPLSIVVIGGLLARSKMTREYWEYIAEHVNTFINSEDDERCLKILFLSYEHLPVHLKPCFLYMGIFPEDHEVRVSKLIKLWVAEGFLKTNKAKSLEEVAEDYLNDLVNRNLIFVIKFGSIGNMKVCKMHDLLRDLCLREAEKERFLFVTKVHDSDISPGKDCQRRIAIHQSRSSYEYSIQVPRAFQSAPVASIVRCFICEMELPQLLRFRLLRVLNSESYYPPEVIFSLVNSRYLLFWLSWGISAIPTSIYLLWNLQTLSVGETMMEIVAPPEIWEMPLLRHLMIYSFILPGPPTADRMDDQHECVLENLQTLSYVKHFRCTEEVLNKIPNIKKLKLLYSEDCEQAFPYYCLKNLDRLKKLESLTCMFVCDADWPSGTDLLQNLEFPLSLKKLTLHCTGVDLEDIATKIGSLPHLEKLYLSCFKGKEWNPVEGHFLRLKFLKIYYSDLVYWTADSIHFPHLEHLVLWDMKRLKEIPCGIGDIATLRSIQLRDCSNTVVVSAKKILQEQQMYGNEDIRLEVDRDGEEATKEEEDDESTEEAK